MALTRSCQNGRIWNARWINLFVTFSSMMCRYCQAGHKYLFSDVSHNWEEARGECELYGGWLVNIGSLQEQNCLMRHGKSEGYNAWYWTDGKYISIK